MFAIYFKFNNRYEIQHCRNRKVLQICYNALIEEGAEIICIKDIRGGIITLN
jgi:hypothetical protein